ncbi:MAG: hypothetical protein ACR652_22700 [Methylocystis sp.]|uniref:hypothetical protein n=1 Tax=Methylocystis sp. TaxID=1911079 RepID=UPI003DA55907
MIADGILKDEHIEKTLENASWLQKKSGPELERSMRLEISRLKQALQAKGRYYQICGEIEGSFHRDSKKKLKDVLGDNKVHFIKLIHKLQRLFPNVDDPTLIDDIAHIFFCQRQQRELESRSRRRGNQEDVFGSESCQ